MLSGITKRVRGHASHEVCPWNVTFAQEVAEGSPFAARAMFRDASSRAGTRALAREILMMKPSDYAAVFRGSAIKRAKLWMLQRNACVVLGNVGTTNDFAVLEAMRFHENMRRGHSPGSSRGATAARRRLRWAIRPLDPAFERVGLAYQTKAASPFFLATWRSLSAIPLGRFAPDSHLATVLSVVFRYRAKTGWLMWRCSRSRLISAGASGGGAEMQAASNSRIVVLVMAPTSNSSLAASWMAANVSLLYFRVLVTADLHQGFLFKQHPQLRVGHSRVRTGERPKHGSFAWCVSRFWCRDSLSSGW